MRLFIFSSTEHFSSNPLYVDRKNILPHGITFIGRFFKLSDLTLITLLSWENYMQIIKGGNARYLGELPEFKNGLPHGVINKTKTDVGGTYAAANCDKDYIIVCPFRDLVDSIAADKNSKYECSSAMVG